MFTDLNPQHSLSQGIYRVSGVKSKVEHLCQRFDLDPESVDLEDVHPNIISNVLKLYLRQVTNVHTRQHVSILSFFIYFLYKIMVHKKSFVSWEIQELSVDS